MQFPLIKIRRKIQNLKRLKSISYIQKLDSYLNRVKPKVRSLQQHRESRLWYRHDKQESIFEFPKRVFNFLQRLQPRFRFLRWSLSLIEVQSYLRVQTICSSQRRFFSHKTLNQFKIFLVQVQVDFQRKMWKMNCQSMMLFIQFLKMKGACQ